MRIFAAARPDLREGGFTLVELMIVLAVLALAATVVLLTLPSGSAQVHQEADRLAMRIAALRDLAIIEGRPMAIVVSPSGYAFERRGRDGWEALPGRGFAPHNWPQDVRLGGNGTPPGRIGFDPVGMTNARVALALTDGTVTAHVILSSTGEVSRRE